MFVNSALCLRVVLSQKLSDLKIWLLQTQEANTDKQLTSFTIIVYLKTVRFKSTVSYFDPESSFLDHNKNSSISISSNNISSNS